MKDKKLPTSVGQPIFEPKYFPNLEDICERLDKLYVSSEISPDVKPSEIFRGALYTMHHQHENQNPDWMSQTANSLRELFYDLKHKNERGINIESALKFYGSTYDERLRIEEVGEYYNFFSKIAHHEFEEASKSRLIDGSKLEPIEITRDKFENVVYRFGKILFSVLRRQLDAHVEIDELLNDNIDESEKIDRLVMLLNINEDAKRYFYQNANENWIEFLWNNGFLDAIKNEAEDRSHYSFSMVELGYLERITENAPDIVTSIILDKEAATTREKFNPEVIDRFIRIASKLPSEYVSEIVKKIEDQKWVVLMGDYNQWGFEYSKILDILFKAEEHESVLVLSKALLEIRDKEDFDKRNQTYFDENPFYFKDLGYLKIFSYISKINDQFLNGALGILLNLFNRILELGEKSKENSAFKIADKFRLYEADLYTLSLSESEHFSERDNVRELIATIIHVTKRIIELYKDNKEYIIGLFNEFFNKLPDSQIVWRLNLFILSLHPTMFTELLKEKLCRVFSEIEENKSFYELIWGTEYQKTIMATFKYFDDNFRRDYVKKVFRSFGTPHLDDADKERKKRYCLQILSNIYPFLLDDEIQFCESYFGKCDPKYNPSPLIRESVCGWVNPKAPITEEEFSILLIPEIQCNLLGSWEPEKLKQLEKTPNLFSPINAEGVGNLLKSDVQARIKEYVENAELFFNREELCEHYTYSYLIGVRDSIRLDENQQKGINWGKLIKLFLNIKNSGEIRSFDFDIKQSDNDDGLISNWRDTHFVIAEIMEDMLSQEEGNEFLDFNKFRDSYLAILKYLLYFPDPKSSDEILATATFTEQSHPETKKVSDPYTFAINSVRGQAFKALIKFVNKESSYFKDNDHPNLSFEVMKLYEDVLNKENTKAIMFLFGRYIPTFYYRNSEWLKSRIQKIFPRDNPNTKLLIAAWEGYLSTDLYWEIFNDPDFQKLYKEGLSITYCEDPERKFFIEPEKGIARHLALAFVFFPDQFGFNSKLFRDFWASGDVKKVEFVNFIGRAIISSDNKKNIEDLHKNEMSRKRIKDFWTWILENDSNPNLFKKFGFWINLSNEIFSTEELVSYVKETLEKSNGRLSWDFGLTEQIRRFSSEYPEITVEIIRLFILEGKVRNVEQGDFFILDDEWLDAFGILYSNESSRNKIESLINILIQEGGQRFWKLEDFIKSNNKE